MNYKDAMLTRQVFYDKANPSADEEFAFTEALAALIEETKNPQYMAELAWFYCSRKRFDLEFKYLELAAECGYGPAFEELGYMYYYGQNGEKDYKKAFECYSKGAEPDKYGNKGSLWCRFKIADMYRFGCYVEKDEVKYREMIEESYEKVKQPKLLNEPFPEIAYRLAGIRAEQGRSDEALRLLKQAKRFLAERLSYDAFWGNIEVMGRIVRLTYTLKPFDAKKADFYDLFYLTQEPGRYEFAYSARPFELEVTGEGEERAINFEGYFYRDFADFCAKACVNGHKVTEVYDSIYDISRLE